MWWGHQRDVSSHCTRPQTQKSPLAYSHASCALGILALGEGTFGVLKHSKLCGKGTVSCSVIDQACGRGQGRVVSRSHSLVCDLGLMKVPTSEGCCDS